jgi:hypothetical protein
MLKVKEGIQTLIFVSKYCGPVNLVLRIRKVSDSNLDLETDLPRPCSKIPDYDLKLVHDCFRTHSF